MMINKGNYLAAADHDLDCDILQVEVLTFGVLTLLEKCTLSRKTSLIFSSHIQEILACSSPCHGRSPE